METKTRELIKNLVPISDAPERMSYKIAEKTLRNWRVKGIYPELFVKLGGKVFVDISEIDRIIDAQKEKARKIAQRLNL